MLRQEKESFVLNIRKDLLGSEIVIVVNRKSGITVEELNKLRKDFVKSKSTFKVIKNTLAKKAIDGSHLECLGKFLTGSTGFAYSNDLVEVSKSIYNFCKENDEKMEIVSGVMKGKNISSDQIKALATLPSMEGIRSQIVGLLSSIPAKLVRTINEPAACIARALVAKKN